VAVFVEHLYEATHVGALELVRKTHIHVHCRNRVLLPVGLIQHGHGYVMFFTPTLSISICR